MMEREIRAEGEGEVALREAMHVSNTRWTSAKSFASVLSACIEACCGKITRLTEVVHSLQCTDCHAYKPHYSPHTH